MRNGREKYGSYHYPSGDQDFFWVIKEERSRCFDYPGHNRCSTMHLHHPPMSGNNDGDSYFVAEYPDSIFLSVYSILLLGC
jgi:hypothetical protein